MSTILWKTLLVAWYVALTPLTHVAIPIVLFVWNVVKHTLVIPLLLMVRIALFGLVYLPLTPVLLAVHVKYDADVAVEVSLFRLVLELMPHVRFFLVNLLHYVMISLFAGGIVGFVAGANLSLVARLVQLPDFADDDSAKSRFSRKTQTTPYFDEMDRKINRLKRENLSEPVTPRRRLEDQGPIVSNLPVIKKEETSPVAVGMKPLALTANQEEFYEDDDGYRYLRYDVPEISPFEHLSHVDSVHTILEEDSSGVEDDGDHSVGETNAQPSTLDSANVESIFTANTLVDLELTIEEEEPEPTK